MNDIKLITLDLDGTLLTSEKIITENTYKALKHASDLGIQIVPCTGRFYEAMPECVKSLDFVNFCINCNGAVVFDVKSKKSIYRSEMSIETGLEVIDYLESLNVASDAYIDNWGYMNEHYYNNIELYIQNPFYIKSVKDYRKPVPSLKETICQ